MFLALQKTAAKTMIDMKTMKDNRGVAKFEQMGKFNKIEE
jgi:hypothetical protein